MGDVFTMPVDDQRVGFGQVVADYKKHGHYLAIFDEIYQSSALPASSEAVQGHLLFLALSLDAKLYVGHWKVVGNEPVAADLPLPAYKEVVNTPDRVDVVDFLWAEATASDTRRGVVAA